MIIGITEKNLKGKILHSSIEIENGNFHPRFFKHDDINGEPLFSGDICLDSHGYLCRIDFDGYAWCIRRFSGVTVNNLERLFETGYQLKKLEPFYVTHDFEALGKIKWDSLIIPKTCKQAEKELPYKPMMVANHIIGLCRKNDILINYFDLQLIMLLFYTKELLLNKALIFPDPFIIWTKGLYPGFCDVRSEFGYSPLTALYPKSSMSELFMDDELNKCLLEIAKTVREHHYDFTYQNFGIEVKKLFQEQDGDSYAGAEAFIKNKKEILKLLPDEIANI